MSPETQIVDLLELIKSVAFWLGMTQSHSHRPIGG